MRLIAQRLCQCTHRIGFGEDERSGMWVCGCCGFPREMYYIAHRSAQRPGQPIKYAKGDYPARCGTKPECAFGRAQVLEGTRGSASPSR